MISRWHFDHAGSLEKFLEINKKSRVFIKKGYSSEFYFKPGFLKKFVGAPESVFKEHRDRLKFISDDVESLPGWTLLARIKKRVRL